jgi:hypothetical protein
VARRCCTSVSAPAPNRRASLVQQTVDPPLQNAARMR